MSLRLLHWLQISQILWLISLFKFQITLKIFLNFFINSGRFLYDRCSFWVIVFFNLYFQIDTYTRLENNYVVSCVIEFSRNQRNIVRRHCTPLQVVVQYEQLKIDLLKLKWFLIPQIFFNMLIVVLMGFNMLSAIHLHLCHTIHCLCYHMHVIRRCVLRYEMYYIQNKLILWMM